MYILVKLRERIRITDRDRCAYCQTSEANSGISLAHDHILPTSLGGEITFENICQSCRPCNEHKGDRITGIDPLAGEAFPLFNPRTQLWHEHFIWSYDGTHIRGITSIGRATVIALQMNNATIVPARERWVAAGWHPPID